MHCFIMITDDYIHYIYMRTLMNESYQRVDRL